MENIFNCIYCGDKIVIPSVFKKNEQELLFCCHGCKSVYEILDSKNLLQYYQLKDNATSDTKGSVNISENKFFYLDDKEFLEKYTRIVANTRITKFYLEGIHCVACLWLLEKLPDFIPGVLTSEVNMSKSTCTVTAQKEIKLSLIAKQFEVLGYKPHPIMESSDIESLRQREDRKMLIKIAVAFACAGNIMLLATSLYAGLEEYYLKEYFRWLNFYLSLPVVLYSATPFYQTAWSALKSRSVSIDIPIVVAIILVTLSGVYNLSIGSDHIYFDSISILVFLLLFARFILKKAQQKGLSASEISSFFSNQIAYRSNKDSDELEVIHAKFLKEYDKIVVPEGENIPADGIVISGSSNINTSLLTGEAIPEKVHKGSKVFSGTVNLDSPLTVQVLKTARDSRLGKILKSVESGWNQKAKIVFLADRTAKYFISSIFSIALICICYFGLQEKWEEGLVRALTLIIITCPCALGLTTPLALTLTLGRLAKIGIIIKNEQIIEKLSKAKEIFLDKTGTLTFGTFRVITWQKHGKDIPDEMDEIIYAMESRSRHPIAKSIVQYLESLYFKNNKTLNPLILNDFKEIPGKGVEATYQNKNYQICKSSLKTDSKVTTVGFFCNDNEILTIELKDQLRKDAKQTISDLKRLNLKPYIISGDSEQTVFEIAKDLDIAKKDVQGHISPEQKNSIIKRHPLAIMVGDGANDAIALSGAFVGIAVHGSVDISLRAADIYISKAGVANVFKVIAASRDTLAVIKRNLSFSLFYNFVGASLALTGHITPLVAAVLMPISSFTVLISTFISTKRLKQMDELK